MAEQQGDAGNVEYPFRPVCEWITGDQDEPCRQDATARVVVGGVGFDVCDEHRRWLVEGHGADS
jgi:hypothetical protein